MRLSTRLFMIPGFYRLATLPETQAKRVRTAIYITWGILAGVLVLHPFSMIIFARTQDPAPSLREALLHAFQARMLPMWLWYGGLGAFWGFGMAVLINRVKIVEGLLPICAWCGKVREAGAGGGSESVWQRLDQYLAKRGVHETHGLCPDCFQQLRAKLPPRGEVGRQFNTNG